MAKHPDTQQDALPRRLSNAREDQTYFAIDEAAARLSTTPAALRARCRRSAGGGARSTIPLGGGIFAVKLGTSWRVRFPGPGDPGNEADVTIPTTGEPERSGALGSGLSGGRRPST